MDLRKGSGVKEGKRRCIRCRGRKKLYKVRGGWCLENSGGVLTDCPMCLGDGLIDIIMPKFDVEPESEPEPEKKFTIKAEEIEEIKEEKEDGKKRRKPIRKAKVKELDSFEKEY